MDRAELLKDICRMHRFIREGLERQSFFINLRKWLRRVDEVPCAEEVRQFSRDFEACLGDNREAYFTAVFPLVCADRFTEDRDPPRAVFSQFLDQHPEIEKFLLENIHRLHDAFMLLNERRALFVPRDEISRAQLLVRQSARRRFRPPKVDIPKGSSVLLMFSSSESCGKRRSPGCVDSPPSPRQV